jgi:hypothetical protein
MREECNSVIEERPVLAAAITMVVGAVAWIGISAVMNGS